MARLWPGDAAMERELIILEWQRGLLSSRAAVVLTRAGLYADAISRAYYAIFHATKATVLTKEIEPTTHQAAGSLLNQHLIYTGELERRWLTHFTDALSIRLDAEYDVKLVFTARTAELACRRAEAFTARIRVYLEAQGFTDAELTVTLPEMPS